ncbi:MAG: NAD(P)-dependent oxidoreductase [Synechococcaceae cyanobacterium]|nr:NAD(P)-dependent oxidoreductase [Synechococcaceae cyanobacterium]
MSPPITVLGAGGWIGSALIASLRAQGRQVEAIDRRRLPAWLEGGEAVGPVIYTIGLTSDCLDFPHATVEAHVGLLSQVLQRPGVKQLVYLSSSRVYIRSGSTLESEPIPCLSSDPSDIYTLSKLLGEALVLQDPRPGLRIVRLSNVFGPQQSATTFLGALLQEARESGIVRIRQPSASHKDYIHLDDVVRLLPQIAETGSQRIYNLGSGKNVSHAEIATLLERQGIKVIFENENKPAVCFPPLAIQRLASEFLPPADPLEQLPAAIKV